MNPERVLVDEAHFDQGGQELIRILRPLTRKGNIFGCHSSQVSRWSVFSNVRPEEGKRGYGPQAQTPD
ncbi:MAG: hypothetical protein COW52_11755 [Nitrospirae bacterium CG17_big_fil_post_rev_8_21_14_2_50_50_9]|nr:MAG: hypothetical protein COW52_11755 [Nitrospirae bacterium CG17_big_fil_post_rev_8_21_14_2_50_50_9]